MKLITHPDNAELLEAALRSQGATNPWPFWGLEVQYSQTVAAREMREEWRPPVERFVEYAPEDEGWARPLGLGQVETFDEGPLFYVLDPNFDLQVLRFPPPWLTPFWK